jgi:mannosyltransferase OCH1-like enzyme
MVWLGSPVPDVVQECVAAWRAALSDWRVLLWDDDATSELGLLAHFGSCPHPVVASDILRALLPFRHGGVYLDIDIWPLTRPPHDLAGKDGYGRPRQPWIVRELDQRSSFAVCNAAMGFPPGHRLPWVVARHAYQQLQRPEAWERPTNRMVWPQIAGPPVWSGYLLATADVQVLAPETFFPVPIWRSYEIRSRDPDWMRDLAEQHVHSYGVHEWRGSWKGSRPAKAASAALGAKPG